jgi:hypothetical protein
MEVRGIGDLKFSSSVVHWEALPKSKHLSCALPSPKLPARGKQLLCREPEWRLTANRRHTTLKGFTVSQEPLLSAKNNVHNIIWFCHEPEDEVLGNDNGSQQTSPVTAVSLGCLVCRETQGGLTAQNYMLDQNPFFAMIWIPTHHKQLTKISSIPLQNFSSPQMHL